MVHLSIEFLEADVEVEQTQLYYSEAVSPDPSCCNACATFLLAVQRDQIPAEVRTFCKQAGIDISKPVEAWGAPDGGFLQMWWPFAGLQAGGVDPSKKVQFSGGFTCCITNSFPGAQPQELAVELTWESATLTALEGEAWPIGA